MPSIPSYSARAARVASLSLGPCLFLATACPSGQTATTDGTGDSDGGSSTTASAGTTAAPTTTGDPTTSTASTTDPAPATSTGPAPAVCGDGVVADTEICDDGNDEPDDGCNKQCEKTGAVEWTYTHNGAAGEDDSAIGVAVDATGRVIIAGYESDAMNNTDMLLIALAPDGAELWKQTFQGPAGLDDFFTDVVVDADGNIYVSGYEETMADISDAVVRAFDPDGGELWTYKDMPPAADYSQVRDLALAPDALYTVGYEGLLDAGAQLVVRRHDLMNDGALVWKTPTQEGTMAAYGQAIAVVGADIIAVGNATDDNSSRPLIAVFTDAGDLVSTDIEDHPGGVWFDVEPIGPDGDLVLAGRRLPRGVTGPDIAVRRVGPDFAVKWTQTVDHDFLYDSATGVAVGPEEAIFVSGLFVKMGELDNIFGGRYSPDGALLWSHTYDNPDIHLYDDGNAAAFGSDFVVIGGSEIVLGEGSNVWVRRLGAD